MRDRVAGGQEATGVPGEIESADDHGNGGTIDDRQVHRHGTGLQPVANVTNGRENVRNAGGDGRIPAREHGDLGQLILDTGAGAAQMIRPDDAEERGALDPILVRPHRGEREVCPIASREQPDLLGSESAAQVLEVLGTLGRVVGGQIHAELAPACRASTSHGFERVYGFGAVESDVRPEPDGSRAVEPRHRQTGSALVEHDDVARRPQVEEQAEERRLQIRGSRQSGAPGQPDDRRAGMARGRRNANECEIDPARRAGHSALGNGEAGELGMNDRDADVRHDRVWLRAQHGTRAGPRLRRRRRLTGRERRYRNE